MPNRFNNVGGFGGFSQRQPASVRNNNPGAQWPGPVATQFGSTGSQRIGGGNLIATFPSPIHGAAAHIALLDRSYTGMTLADAIRKWTGRTSDPSAYIRSVSQATGLKSDTVLTHDIFANPGTALPFVQAMAGQEAGASGTLTSEQWKQGYEMAFPNAAGPTVEVPRGNTVSTGNFLEIDPSDTSRDPGGISSGGELSLGGDTSLGADLGTDFTGPEYAESNYQPSGPESPIFAENLYDPTGNAPHEAMDFTDTQGVAANSFDEWWKTEPITASGDVSASASANTGGGIWAGDETLSNFGKDVALGGDLNADLGSLGYGEDYPATPESPFTPLAEGTGIPVEPDPLNQNPDTEWTTSPGDRRFLPEPEPSVEPTPTRSLAGPNIRNFGGQSYNTPLSLGAYLNMPLSSMRYGEGHPDVGHVFSAGTEDSTGTTFIDQGAGLTDRQLAEQHRQSVEDGQFNAWPRGELLSPQPPEGMHIIGHDTVNGQPIYEDAQGNRFVNPGTGTQVMETSAQKAHGDRNWSLSEGPSGWQPGDRLHDTASGTPITADTGSVFFGFSASDNQGAEQQMQDPVKFGMNPTSDAGHNVNLPGQSGFNDVLGEDGVVVERRPIKPNWIDPAMAARLREWSRQTTGMSNWGNPARMAALRASLFPGGANSGRGVTESTAGGGG